MMKERSTRDGDCLLLLLGILGILSAANTPAWALSGDCDYEITGTVLVGLSAAEELNLLPPGSLKPESPGATITGDLVVFGPQNGNYGGKVTIEYAIITGHIGVDENAIVRVKGKDFAVSEEGVFDNPVNPTSVTFPYKSGTLFVTYENGTRGELHFYQSSLQPIYLGEETREAEKPEYVTIDIKPGSDVNPINPLSKGVVPVAVFTTDTFDATEIDPATVLLAGAKVATRGNSSKLMFHLEDVDGDGLIDLMLQIDVQSEGAAWVTGEVEFTAETFGGKEVEGSDEIVVVTPGKHGHRHGPATKKGPRPEPSRRGGGTRTSDNPRRGQHEQSQDRAYRTRQ